jgi:hypothetical protein
MKTSNSQLAGLARIIAWAFALIAVTGSVSAQQVEIKTSDLVTPVQITEFFIKAGIIPASQASAARDVAGFIPMAAPMTNSSSLVHVDDKSPLVSGFTVGKSNANAVFLLRVIGAGLSDYGIKDGLEDPVVEIRRGETIVAQMYDWNLRALLDPSSVIEMRNAERMAGAAPLKVGNRDVAGIVRLPEGAYTATVRGSDDSKNRSGTVLFEMYALPELVGNSAPTAPQVHSATPTAHAGKPFEFTVTSTDKDGDELEYWFDWDDDGTAVRQDTIKGHPSQDTHITHTWMTAGTKFFRILAMDSKGAVSSTTRVTIDVNLREE